MTGEPLHVMHVADSAGWAGGETYVRLVAGALDRRRFRMSVVVPEPGPLVERLRALDVPTFEVPAAGRLLSVAALRGLIGVFRAQRPVLVQSHGARSNVYTRLAARVAGVPAVFSTVHNSLFDHDVSPWRRRAYVLAERATSPLADRIIAVSAAIGADLVRRYGIRAARTLVIHNGIDVGAFRPGRLAGVVRAELGLRSTDRVVGMAARMTKQKGHDLLLDALGRLAPRFPALALLLVGDGPRRRDLEAMAAALGVSDRCRFTGARADVADLMGAVDIVALPSRSAGLPFALLEAMALGKPVVASTAGGNAEVVEDTRTGRLVPPNDAAALAAALADILQRPDAAAEMGRRGRARVGERFRLDRMVGALEDAYLSVLGSKGLGPTAVIAAEVR